MTTTVVCIDITNYFKKGAVGRILTSNEIKISRL